MGGPGTVCEGQVLGDLLLRRAEEQADSGDCAEWSWSGGAGCYHVSVARQSSGAGWWWWEPGGENVLEATELHLKITRMIHFVTGVILSPYSKKPQGQIKTECLQLFFETGFCHRVAQAGLPWYTYLSFLSAGIAIGCSPVLCGID